MIIFNGFDVLFYGTVAVIVLILWVRLAINEGKKKRKDKQAAEAWNTRTQPTERGEGE